MKKYNSKKQKSKRRYRYYIAFAIAIIILGNSTCVYAQEVLPNENVEESDSFWEEHEAALLSAEESAGSIEKSDTKNRLEKVGDTLQYENGTGGECYLQAGDYTIEVAGAGGAASSSTSFLPGGNGGLVSGKFHFDKETTLSYTVGTGGTCIKGTQTGVVKNNGTPGGGKGYRVDAEEENVSGGGGGYSSVMLKGEYLLVAGGGAGADSSAEMGGHAGEDGGSGGGQTGMPGANGNQEMTENGAYATGGGGGGYRGGNVHLGGTSYISPKANHTQMLSGKGAIGGKEKGDAGQDGTIKITWNACSHEEKKLVYDSLSDYCNHKVVCEACKEDIKEMVPCTDEDENGFCDICNQLVSPYFKEQEETKQAFTYGTEGTIEFGVKIEKVEAFSESLQWYCRKDGALELLEGETDDKLILQKDKLDTGNYEYFCIMSYDGPIAGSKQSFIQTVEVTVAEGSIAFGEPVNNNQLTLYKKYNAPNEKEETAIPYIYNADLDTNSYGKGEIQLSLSEQSIVQATINKDRKELILHPVRAGEQEIILMATEGENYTACQQKLQVKVDTGFKTGDILWDFSSNEKGNISISGVHREDGDILPEKVTVPQSFAIDGQKMNVDTLKTNTFLKESGVKELTILENVTTIEKQAIDKEIRIITVPGSAAEKYARENGNQLFIKTDKHHYEVVWKDKEWVAEQYIPTTRDPILIIPEKVDGYPIAGFGKDAVAENTEQIIVQGAITQFPSDASVGNNVIIAVIKGSLAEQSAIKNAFGTIHYLALGGIEAKLTADSIAATGSCIDTSKITIIGYWNQERTQSGVISWDKLTTVPGDLTVHYQGINKYIIGYYDAYTSFVINGYIPQNNKINEKPGSHSHKKRPAKDTDYLKKHFEKMVQEISKQDIGKMVDTDIVHISKDIVENLYQHGIDKLNEEQKNRLFKSELAEIEKEDVQKIVEKIQEGVTVSIEDAEILETIEEDKNDYNHAYRQIVEKEHDFKKKIVMILILTVVFLFTVLHINVKIKRRNKGEQWNES